MRLRLTAQKRKVAEERRGPKLTSSLCGAHFLALANRKYNPMVNRTTATHHVNNTSTEPHTAHLQMRGYVVS